MLRVGLCCLGGFLESNLGENIMAHHVLGKRMLADYSLGSQERFAKQVPSETTSASSDFDYAHIDFVVESNSVGHMFPGALVVNVTLVCVDVCQGWITITS